MGTNFKELAEYFDAGDFTTEAKKAEPVNMAAGSADANEPMDAFTVRLPVSVLETVRAIAAQEGESTGAILRRMVESAVAEHTSDQAVVPVSALRELISLAQNDEQTPGQRKKKVERSAITRARGKAATRSASHGRLAGKKSAKRKRVS